MINRLVLRGRWEHGYGRQAVAPQKIPFSGYITLWSYKLFFCPAAKHNEDSRRARETQWCGSNTHTSESTQHVHPRYQVCTQTHTHIWRRSHTVSTATTHTHAHTRLFAWWTFIRMQSRGIMWFKQSRHCQTRPPAEFKISPNTLRDQIIGPYVDLTQSSHTCVCVDACMCVFVRHVCRHYTA